MQEHCLFHWRHRKGGCRLFRLLQVLLEEMLLTTSKLFCLLCSCLFLSFFLDLFPGMNSMLYSRICVNVSGSCYSHGSSRSEYAVTTEEESIQRILPTRREWKLRAFLSVILFAMTKTSHSYAILFKWRERERERKEVQRHKRIEKNLHSTLLSPFSGTQSVSSSSWLQSLSLQPDSRRLNQEDLDDPSTVLYYLW